jgi:hypothetical protein
LDTAARNEIYKKFGYVQPRFGEVEIESETTKINHSSVGIDFQINEETLGRNLNQNLFYDIYLQALDSLDQAFE